MLHCTLEHLLLVAGCCHTSSLTTRILKNDEWPLPAPHHTTPDHYTNGGLLEAWAHTVIIKLFTYTPCPINKHCCVVDMDVRFTSLTDVTFVVHYEALHVQCPFMAVFIGGLCEV